MSLWTFSLQHACATVRHLCLQALQVITSRGRHFCDISRKQFGGHAPVTLSIEGFVLKVSPREAGREMGVRPLFCFFLSLWFKQKFIRDEITAVVCSRFLDLELVESTS